jgi:hypothetical protein
MNDCFVFVFVFVFCFLRCLISFVLSLLLCDCMCCFIFVCLLAQMAAVPTPIPDDMTAPTPSESPHLVATTPTPVRGESQEGDHA